MSSSEARFEEIMAAYLEAAGRGEAPSRAELLAKHPEQAERLGRFLDNEEWLREAMQGDKRSALPTTVGVEPSVGESTGTRLRYVGDYEILEEIGRGGMGVVYRARQVSLGRDVALKMVLAGEHAGADALRRFRTEAEAAANLDHPNIVPVYEVGVHEGQPYFSMKRIEGTSLAEAMAGLREKPREIAALLERVARAVHHAHQRGVLHRDLKPGNILLDKSGEPHIADFGLARRGEGGGSLSGAVIGTPEFMAPEQALGRKDLTVAADVYSLGATLYALLAGKPPFEGGHVLDVLRAVVGEEPGPLAGDLGLIALKCLSKEPGKRYESAAALANDLKRWLDGEPVRARPAGRVERLRIWCRRNPTTAALVGVSVLSLLCLVGGGIWFTLQIQEERDSARQARDGAIEERQRTKDALRETRRALAGSRVSQAFRAWQDRQPLIARTLLDSCPREDRLWEWHYARRLSDGGLFLLDGHTARVLEAAFSPDGRTLASASSREVLLREARAGQELQHFPQASGTIAFSPDGKRLATGTPTGSAKVFDTATGKELFHLPGSAIRALAWSPDGKTLATGSRLRARGEQGRYVMIGKETGEIRLWDMVTGQPTRAFQGRIDPVYRLAFSPDGELLASAGEKRTVRLWDVRTGKIDRSFSVPSSFAVCDSIVEIAFSPDGRYLAAKTEEQYEPQAKARAPGNVRVWEVASGKDVLTAEEFPAGHLAFRPDSKYLVAVEDRVRLRDLKTGQEVPAFAGCGGVGPAYSPDGRRLALSDGLRVCIREVEGVVEAAYYREPANPRFYRLDLALPVELAVEHRQIKVLGGASETEVVIRHLPTGKELYRGWDGEQRVLDVSRDGKRAALGRDTVTVLDVASGVSLLSLDRKMLGTSANCFSLAPDGRSLAVGTGHVLGGIGDVQVWDIDRGERRFRAEGHTLAVLGLAWSPDGETLASTSALYNRDESRFERGEVILRDARTGEERFTLRGQEGVRKLAFSTDGLRLATGGEFVKIWDARSGQELLTLKGFSGQGDSRLEFLPDGRLLSWSAPGPDSRRGVRVCDGRPLPEPRVLAGPKDQYASVVLFHPDGRRLALATDGGSKPSGVVQMWEYRTGKLLYSLPEAGPVLALDPSGKLLAEAGPAGAPIRIRDADTGAPVRTLPGHKQAVIALAFSSDGKRLAAFSEDGQLKIRDVTTGRELLALTHPDKHLYGVKLAFLPDGRLVASDGATSHGRVWDSNTGASLPPVDGVMFPHGSQRSPDGRVLARSESGGVALVDLVLDDAELAHRRALTAPLERENGADNR